jgi:hypothetical protein
VSRGIGSTQREALLCLWHHPEGAAGGMPLGDLKRAISADRSNARRAIRGLLARGLVEEVRGDEGERRVRLTGGAHVALFLSGYLDQPLTLSDVPSRPLNLAEVVVPPAEIDIPSADTVWESHNPMSLRLPHESSRPPSDLPVNDNTPGAPAGGDPMHTRKPHAHPARDPDRSVSDLPPYTPGLGLEIVARMAREWLARLDEDADKAEKA